MQVFLRYILRSRISRCKDTHILISTGYEQGGLQNGCTNLHSHQDESSCQQLVRCFNIFQSDGYKMISLCESICISLITSEIVCLYICSLTINFFLLWITYSFLVSFSPYNALYPFFGKPIKNILWLLILCDYMKWKHFYTSIVDILKFNLITFINLKFYDLCSCTWFNIR